MKIQLNIFCRTCHENIEIKDDKKYTDVFQKHLEKCTIKGFIKNLKYCYKKSKITNAYILEKNQTKIFRKILVIELLTDCNNIFDYDVHKLS